MNIDLLDDKYKYHYYFFEITTDDGVTGSGVVKTIRDYFPRNEVMDKFYNTYNQDTKNKIGLFKEIKEIEYINSGFDGIKDKEDDDLVLSYNYRVRN